MKYVPRTIDILSFLYTIGYFVTLWLSLWREFPAGNKDALNVLLGVLTVILTTIVNSYTNKDTANSATVSTIKALKSDPAAPTVPDGGAVGVLEVKPEKGTDK